MRTSNNDPRPLAKTDEHAQSPRTGRNLHVVEAYGGFPIVEPKVIVAEAHKRRGVVEVCDKCVVHIHMNRFAIYALYTHVVDLASRHGQLLFLAAAWIYLHE